MICPASDCLLASDPWNDLIGAAATFITGAELDKVSAFDLNGYSDTEINWRVAEGYGHLIAASGAALDVTLDCIVTRIDARDPRIRVETSCGAVVCDRVLITIPTSVLSTGAIEFLPALPEKLDAASRLPLGLNDKLFLSLTQAEEFEKDSRVFGRTDRVATATHHIRPFGRSQIEAYFGGSLAHELESGGPEAFFNSRKRSSSICSVMISENVSAFSRCTVGARTFTRADPIRMPFPVTRAIARRSQHRWTTGSISRARPVRNMISPPRMAPISRG